MNPLSEALEDVLVGFEASDNTERAATDNEALLATPSAQTKEDKNIIDETLVRDVLKSVKDDPILALSDVSLDFITILDVQELTIRLKPLTTCLKRSIFRSSSREKSWSEFYRHQEDIISSIKNLIPHTPIASFVVFKFMEKLINIETSSPITPTSVEPVQEEEKDIVCYVGGFVLFRCKKVFINNPLCLSVVRDTLKSSPELFTSKLISTKSRGGLCEPKDDMVLFFLLCESVFRDMFSSFQNQSVELFKESIFQREDIMSLFYTCTYDCDVEVKIKEQVISNILSSFFRLRCHAKCRKFMEQYVYKTKTQRKQKALRKKLATDAN